MKHLIIIILSLLLVNCSHDDGAENNIDVSQIPFPEASFKVTLKYDFETFSTISTTEYSFDTNGNVLAAKYINADNPEQNSFTTFQYDANGRILSATRNNHIMSHVIWDGNTAKVYDGVYNVPFSFVFLNGNLSEIISANSESHQINYDMNNNIISEERNHEVFVEYLNYNLSVPNPIHVLKSIAILGYNSGAFSNNIFETKKVYPYEDIDYVVSLNYYQFQYTFDQDNRVITMTDDQSGIYKTFFEYY